MVIWMRSADAGGSPKPARASLTQATTPGDESARGKSESQLMACTIVSLLALRFRGCFGGRGMARFELRHSLGQRFLAHPG